MNESNNPYSVWLNIFVVLLTLTTALTHIALNFPDLVFILNGMGYLALIAGLYLPISQFDARRRLIRRVFMAYTLLTILLWVAIGERSPTGFFNKLIEVTLLLTLFLAERQTVRSA